VSEHTPGPWRTASYDQGLTWKVETVDGRKAVASYIAGLGKTDEANARLIAAAPDLLAIAKALDAWWSALPPGVHDDLWSRTIDVLAKVEGR